MRHSPFQRQKNSRHIADRLRPGGGGDGSNNRLADGIPRPPAPPGGRLLRIGGLITLLAGAFWWLGQDRDTLPVTQTLALPGTEPAATAMAPASASAPTVSKPLPPEAPARPPVAALKPAAPEASIAPSNSLQEANQRAIALASQGDPRQAASVLEASLLAHPESGPAFDNLRRLYAGFASQSYQMAIDPAKAQPVVVELAHAGRNISVQLPSAAAAQTPLKTAQRLPDPQNMPSLPPIQVAVNSQPVATAAPVLPSTPASAPAIVPVPTPDPTPVVAPLPAAATPAPVAAPAPTPLPVVVPEPEPATPKALTAEQRRAATAAVMAAVKDWAKAWSAQNADAYIAAYAPDYHPKGVNRKDWEDYRRLRVTAPKFIQVELTDIKAWLIDNTSMRVSFTQAYASDTLKAKDKKTLELTLIDNQWRITHESGR